LEKIALSAGLLFDRLRIVDFLNEINNDLITKVRLWNTSAFAAAERAITQDNFGSACCLGLAVTQADFAQLHDGG